MLLEVAWLDIGIGCAAGFVLGWIASLRWERRAWLPKNATGPLPEPAADHRHEWYDRPSLHDPASGQHIYACQNTTCSATVRVRGLLKPLFDHPECP